MAQTLDMHDKVALITGAASGIGRATAELLSQLGAAVVLVDRLEEVENAAVALTDKGRRSLAVRASVNIASDMEHAVRSAVETFGSLDMAANVAGISGNPAAVANLDAAAWDEVLAMNLSGIFYAMRYEIPAMLTGRGGAIVNISSVFASRGLPGRAPYTASKHGIHGITRCAAIEYAASGIRVNDVQPGVIETPMLTGDAETTRTVTQGIPQGRVGKAEEVAWAIAFLLSDRASYISGTQLAVDGAYLA